MYLAPTFWDELRAAREQRAADLSAMRQALHQQLIDYNVDRATMAITLRQQLSVYVDQLRRDTADQLQALAVSQQERALAQRHARRASIARLRDDVAVLRASFVRGQDELSLPLPAVPPRSRAVTSMPPVPPRPATPTAVAASPMPAARSKEEAVAMRPELTLAQQGLSAAQRPNRSGVLSSVQQLRKGILDELADAKQVLTAAQRDKLNGFVLALQRSVHPFLQEVRSAHQVLTDDQRRQLNAYLYEVRRSLVGLVTELDTSSYLLSDEQRRQMGDYLLTLRGDVRKLLVEVNAAYGLVAVE